MYLYLNSSNSDSREVMRSALASISREPQAVYALLIAPFNSLVNKKQSITVQQRHVVRLLGKQKTSNNNNKHALLIATRSTTS